MRNPFDYRWGVLLWTLFIGCSLIACKSLRDLQQTDRQRLEQLKRERADLERRLWLVQDEQALLTYKLNHDPNRTDTFAR